MGKLPLTLLGSYFFLFALLRVAKNWVLHFQYDHQTSIFNPTQATKHSQLFGEFDVKSIQSSLVVSHRNSSASLRVYRTWNDQVILAR